MLLISIPPQELASLGLSSTYIEATSPEGTGLNAVPALNAMYELLQIHRRTMSTVEGLEKEQLKKSSTMELMQTSNTRLKACITADLSFNVLPREKVSLLFLCGANILFLRAIICVSMSWSKGGVMQCHIFHLLEI